MRAGRTSAQFLSAIVPLIFFGFFDAEMFPFEAAISCLGNCPHGVEPEFVDASYEISLEVRIDRKVALDVSSGIPDRDDSARCCRIC